MGPKLSTENVAVLNAPLEGSEYKRIVDPTVLEESYAEYFTDESNLVGGVPAALCFPSSWTEVSQYLAATQHAATPVVVAGARTGLAGGALGQSGVEVLSLEKVHYIETSFAGSIDTSPRVRVGAGVRLVELQEYIEQEFPEYWFPVDPTETSASFGGMVSVGASGARGYKYGSIRAWVSWIRVVLADGSFLEIPRGSVRCENNQLRFAAAQREIQLSVTQNAQLQGVKSTIGYALAPDMDGIDLFIGAEGTLGVITDIELQLAPRPKEFLYILQFCEKEELALELVAAIDAAEGLAPLAIESCDATALGLISSSAHRNDSRAIQHIRPDHQAAVYFEFAADSQEEIDAQLIEYFAIAEKLQIAVEDCIAGSEPRDVRDMKLFRHAIPETINARIRQRKTHCPALHKLALDMAVPKAMREEIFQRYRQTFSEAGLEFSIFGHAGDAHYHVNILARDEDELRRAKELYASLAKSVVTMGGSVAAEHGIGRLKKHLLLLQHSDGVLAEFAQIKHQLDPSHRLQPGVLFEFESGV